MDNLLVSIIIPTFNRSNIIIETLDSLKTQTYTNWECIIVDDGSTDDTQKVIESYILNDQRFKYFKRPDNYSPGGNGARNFGFDISLGEFINWIDSDDVLHKNFIKNKIKVFQENSDLDVVISKSVLTQKDISNIIKYEDRTHNTNYLIDDFITLKVSWYIPDPMWKKSFLSNKLLFNSKLLKGQDRDFHTRMLLYNPKIYFLDEYLYYYRDFSETISYNFDFNVILTVLEQGFIRNKLLVDYGISNKSKVIILKHQLDLYKFVYKDKKVNKLFFKQILQLRNSSLSYFMLILKFLFYAVSFNMFNRGEIFMK